MYRTGSAYTADLTMSAVSAFTGTYITDGQRSAESAVSSQQSQRSAESAVSSQQSAESAVSRVNRQQKSQTPLFGNVGWTKSKTAPRLRQRPVPYNDQCCVWYVVAAPLRKHFAGRLSAPRQTPCRAVAASHSAAVPPGSKGPPQVVEGSATVTEGTEVIRGHRGPVGVTAGR